MNISSKLLSRPRPQAYENTDGRPTWSPDSSKVAAQLGTDVVVLDRGEAAILNKIGPEGRWVDSPDWSPDGSRITFATFDKHEGSDTTSWAVYSSAPDGSDMKLLSKDAMEPEYNPQGDRIAFQHQKSSIQRIAVMDSDGKNMKLVSSGGFMQRDFSWSPGGHQVAYDGYFGGGKTIYITDITGRKERPITDGAGGLYNDENPEWSPDGDNILFERQNPAVQSNSLWVVNPRTKKEKQVLQAYGRNLDATWSPDGKQIAFASDRDGQGDLDLYVMNIDGTGLKQVTDMPGHEHAPSWSPDGKAIAFNRLDFDKPKDSRESVHIVELNN